jgi:hypothetical protein
MYVLHNTAVSTIDSALYIATHLISSHYINTQYAADHKQLEKMLDDISDGVKSLKAGNSTTNLNQLLIDYEIMMLPHLEQEEVECLPLCRAYFTPAEIGAKVQEIIKNEPKVGLGSVISCMGVATFRTQFMRQEGIPWFVWYLAFRGCVKEFERRFSVPMQALVDGEAPSKATYKKVQAAAASVNVQAKAKSATSGNTGGKVLNSGSSTSEGDVEEMQQPEKDTFNV